MMTAVEGMDDDSQCRWEMEWMMTAIDVGLGDSFN